MFWGSFLKFLLFVGLGVKLEMQPCWKCCFKSYELTKLSSLFATIEANLCSPANSDIRKTYSGEVTWFDRCVLPANQTIISFQFQQKQLLFYPKYVDLKSLRSINCSCRYSAVEQMPADGNQW